MYKYLDNCVLHRIIRIILFVWSQNVHNL
uniref:Uncharacterized protein n=1 Tax=Rhizophora mucronata TaxID=61149 RepID=A0A2P2QJ97_RHIMU